MTAKVQENHPVLTRLQLRIVQHFVTVLTIGLTHYAAAADPTVFAANYDIKLGIGDAEYQIQTQAQVRSGHTIPVDFGKHRIDLQVTEMPSKKYVIVVSLSEKTENGWYLVTSDPPKFEGEFGIPVQFTWSSGDVAIDMAIAVSPVLR